MQLKVKQLFLLLAILVTLTIFIDMADAQRERTRSARRRNNRRRGRNNRRVRNRNRGRVTGRGRARGRGRTAGRRGGGAATSGGDAESTEGCEEITVPMCKGLIPYTHTKLPNAFNHTTQYEAHQELEHLWGYMDHSCSVNTRIMACATYLPKCTSSNQNEGPCKQTCMNAKRACSRSFSEMFSVRWADVFMCRGLPRTHCVAPEEERVCSRQHPECINMTAHFPVCSGLSFTYGTMPNMFHQCHENLIATEMQHYTALRASNCHASLDFLLCGVYSPFCLRTEVPFSFPCREICDEVRTACESTYRQLYSLPWPNKLQCHRYPSTESIGGHRCVMPNEGSTLGAA